MDGSDRKDSEAIERKISPTDEDRNSDILEFSRGEERGLLRKFDFFILPPLAFMYLCNALDKGNVGNAKTAGWDVDIGLVGNQYYLLVMIFYVPFCLFGTPISLFVKRFSAARVLPLMMIGFGSMALLAGAAKNFSQIFAIRFFLGIFESPMLPAVVYYLSTFYKRNELASRVGLFYAAASIAGAFSGLIAYGVFHIKHSKYFDWQFLFWIEGGGTIIFATFAWFWLPRTPGTWKFLSDRQKDIARSRILADSSVVIDEKVDIKDAFRPFKSVLYWVWILISLSLGVPLASVNNFLPQIIASLHYSTVKTNLFTVAPNIVGTVALLLLTFSSDYFRERSIHMSVHLSIYACLLLTKTRSCIPLATAIVGFLILRFIDTLEHLHCRLLCVLPLDYGGFCSVCIGGHLVFVETILTKKVVAPLSRQSWLPLRIAPVRSYLYRWIFPADYGRLGLISTNVFRAQDEPKYVPALATSAAFGALCLILVAGTGIWMRWENAKRNRAQGVNLQAQDVDTSTLSDGPANPNFRYMY
ncbi:major facilitator superfamily domain-containing protein [Mycena metata]|uniref:Major facilitator superfamily domain-containing protein n=1 Tax=Mycena metata TaxID=1033252 RepID=A0AAD7KJH2_9AGAR|nr:major facilitator superfamily domain-containing protein [Mycena metata]